MKLESMVLLVKYRGGEGDKFYLPNKVSGSRVFISSIGKFFRLANE